MTVRWMHKRNSVARYRLTGHSQLAVLLLLPPNKWVSLTTTPLHTCTVGQRGRPTSVRPSLSRFSKRHDNKTLLRCIVQVCCRSTEWRVQRTSCFQVYTSSYDLLRVGTHYWCSWLVFTRVYSSVYLPTLPTTYFHKKLCRCRGTERCATNTKYRTWKSLQYGNYLQGHSRSSYFSYTNIICDLKKSTFDNKV